MTADTARARSRIKGALAARIRSLRHRRDARIATGAARLAQSGRHADAVARYLKLLGESPRGDWRSRIAARSADSVPRSATASALADLVSSLESIGDVDGALAVARLAGRRAKPGSRLLASWSRLAEREGFTAEAIAAQRRAVERAKPGSPRARHRLATLCIHAGRWVEARAVLEELLREHPDHAGANRLLATVHGNVARWGGSFVASEPASASTTVEFVPEPDSAGSPADRSSWADARAALARAVDARAENHPWRAALADAMCRSGDIEGGIALLDAVIADVRPLEFRSAHPWLQRHQFERERWARLHGTGIHDDPLHECRIGPADPEVASSAAAATTRGVFAVETTYSGISFSGTVADPRESPQIVIEVDGRPIRRVRVSPRGAFAFVLGRRAVARLPSRSSVSLLSTADGRPLRSDFGSTTVELRVPHGDGTLADVLAAGGQLDKKGQLSPGADETLVLQSAYLDLYERVLEVFERDLDQPLLLLYGNLLGLVREREFIPGDDDFDVGFVAAGSDPASVKAELADVAIALLRAGFPVSVNHLGRIKAVHSPDLSLGIEFRPIWFADGRVHIPTHSTYASDVRMFLPARQDELRGRRVLAPAEPEHFLLNHYGPDWSVPDPGFTYYRNELDPRVRDYFDSAMFSREEYAAFRDRVRRELRDVAGAGELIAPRMAELYPNPEAFDGP